MALQDPGSGWMNLYLIIVHYWMQSRDAKSCLLGLSRILVLPCLIGHTSWMHCSNKSLKRHLLKGIGLFIAHQIHMKIFSKCDLIIMSNMKFGQVTTLLVTSLHSAAPCRMMQPQMAPEILNAELPFHNNHSLKWKNRCNWDLTISSYVFRFIYFHLARGTMEVRNFPSAWSRQLIKDSFWCWKYFPVLSAKR